MIIKRYKTFLKSYKKLNKKIQDKVDSTLIKFSKNPFDETLKNHALNGKYKECRSINITGDYRLIFRELSNGSYEIIELINIGTHSQLY